jgi:hypothetical protein
VIYINTVLGTVQQNPQIKVEGGIISENIEDQTIIINGTKPNIKRAQGVSP